MRACLLIGVMSSLTTLAMCQTDDNTALMRAIPDIHKVQLLVEHGANVNALAGSTTPLLIAAGINSAEEVLRYLIAKGADLQAVDAQGSDAVMAAALAGAAGNLKILLDAGASSSNEAKVRQIPQALRAEKLDEATRDRLKKRAEGVTALINAARVDCLACVHLLLEHGADAKAATNAGLTALHYAAFKGNSALVRLLLDAGARVNVADDRGFTPLMMAANSTTKDPAVVRMLLERGADLQAKDGFGQTAADWARTGGHQEIIQLLSQPVHDSVSKALTLLEQAAPKFFPKSGCISCHNVSIPLMALTEARRRGYSVNQAATQQLVKQTVATYQPLRELMASGACGIPGGPSVASYSAISLKSAGYAADAITDGMIHCLALSQFADGHWHLNIDTRPPLSAEGQIPETALAARAIQSYMVPAMSAELQSRVQRARAFLASARPKFAGDHAFRLLGLVWTDAASVQIAAASRELLAEQRPDGGWAQNADMASDAYATGLSLSALATADAACAKTVPYRKGVDYLMRTQEADGSWHVRSRAFGFQPYFESGFPHGHDQWISMAATAWSVMALMPAGGRD